MLFKERERKRESAPFFPQLQRPQQLRSFSSFPFLYVVTLNLLLHCYILSRTELLPLLLLFRPFHLRLRLFTITAKLGQQIGHRYKGQFRGMNETCDEFPGKIGTGKF